MASEHLLGNEAIVRGALEAGVVFVAGYPGTPSSEITDGFARFSKTHELAFEYAVNEKIALELAFAAALAGARSLCAMKHLGLMVAGDPLSTIPYVGVEAGMVIVSAGDPSCATSPNEADQRHLARMLHVPVLDPSTPAEAHAMTRAAFDLSEACRLPVLLRTTTRVAHSRSEVSVGPIVTGTVRGFVRNPARYVPMPMNARRMRVELKDRVERARAWLARSAFLHLEGTADDVVLATGSPAATTHDVLRVLDEEGRIPVWRVGAVYPLPEDELAAALGKVKRVLVVEELSPFLEDSVLALAHRHGLHLEVLGKRTGHFPEEFEYEPALIQRALFEAFGAGSLPRKRPAMPNVPPRAPTMCPGCPHRAAFAAARSAFDAEQLFFNDIGCYTLGYAPPLRTADALLCMGAGFTLAAGVARVTGKRTVGAMGDSTFFHAGMPALLDAIKEDANVVAVVLDNRITAMTGFQESPTEGRQIEDVARALGARHVEVVDPYDQAAAIAAFQRARDGAGTSVVVVRRTCPVSLTRSEGAKARAPVYVADPDACRTCGREALHLRCEVPATEGYERNLARVASLRTEHEPGPAIAPCAARCPLSLCIQGYVGTIAAGEYAEAAAHVMARTVLPESVCRVCHRPCEKACVRGAQGEPVAINDLKRFVVEWAERNQPGLLAPNKGAPSGLRAAVVGAGPSGLAASADLVARGWDVTLFDAAERAGGLLTHAIPEHRLPEDAIAKDLARVMEIVTFRPSTRLGRDTSLARLAGEYDAVYVAIGANAPRTLALPGTRPAAVLPALDYLRASRTSAAVPPGRKVVVIGGGNAAIDAARTALRHGAGRVVVACIEPRAEMPALEDEIVQAEREGIVLRTGVRPARWDERGVWAGGAEGEALIEADLVLVAIGQDVDGGALDKDGVQLARTPEGLVIVDPATCATSHPRIFAGGDVVPGERNVTVAIACGLRAAWGMDAALRGRKTADRRAPPAIPTASARGWRVEAPSARRRPAPELDPKERVRSSSEVALVYSEPDARAEAMRCLMCGKCGNCRACIEVLGCPALAMDAAGAKVVVDPVWCIGCGVCEKLCSNRALSPIDAGNGGEP